MFFAIISEMDISDRAFMLALYENYYGLVRKTIYGITFNKNNIEDLIDDVFVKLIKKAALLRTFNSCKTTAYVVYTSRSIAINHIKHNDVEKKHMFYLEDLEVYEDTYAEDGPEDLIMRKDELRILSDAILQLPQNKKDILHFKYRLKMSDEEIAQKLGISTNSVREYLTRARRQAKKLMEKEVNGNIKYDR